MIKVKKFLFFALTFALLFTFFLYREKIWTKLTEITNPETEIIIPKTNSYLKQNQFKLIQDVQDYVPYTYKDLMNIFYTALNHGWSEFTFRCPAEYQRCLKDVAQLSYDEVLLSDINNYVHPYNSYPTIKTLYDDTGEVTIKIVHLYTEEEIAKIDKDIDQMIESVTKQEMTTKEKIKALHDYIINETKYDTKRVNEKESEYDSARITGVLYDHYSICSGYTDLMAVILEKLKVPNFKVASKTHVWNAAYIDKEWLHLDLTWDDPVTTSGNDILDDSYFLIRSDQLKKLDNGSKEHAFDKDVYLEFKE